MPQNNPMTPEHTTCEGCRWWHAGLCSNYESCLDHEWWEIPPAQLIRSTLEAAAERVKLKRWCTGGSWDMAIKTAVKAILEPLTKEKI
jgi:hypothetical protein